MTRPENPAVTHVREQLAALRAVQAGGQQAGGRPPQAHDTYGAVGFAMLPPADEAVDIERRIALYETWLARHGPKETEHADAD